MARAVHFEIHATDPEQVKAFYEAVFGWRIERWGTDPYWTISTGVGRGIDGGLLPRKGPRPAPDTPVGAFVITIEVADLAATMAAVTATGGVIALDKQPVPNVGWLAYCADPDGNLFGVLQPSASAS
jgi:predicted enzyme related to lactoylglutathione lyase